MSKKAFLVLLVIVAFATVAGAEQKMYTVRKGDTMSGVVWTLNQEAGVHVGLGDLQKWNPEISTALKEGQVIVYHVPETQKAVTVEDVKTAVTEAIKAQPKPAPAVQVPVQVDLAEEIAKPMTYTRFLVNIVITVAVLAFLVGVFFLIRRRRPAKLVAIEEQKTVEVSVIPPQPKKTKVEFSLHGGLYTFYVEEGDGFICPINLEGEVKTLPTIARLRDELKYRLKKTPGLEEKLIGEGVLTVQNYLVQ